MPAALVIRTCVEDFPAPIVGSSKAAVTAKSIHLPLSFLHRMQDQFASTIARVDMLETKGRCEPRTTPRTVSSACFVQVGGRQKLPCQPAFEEVCHRGLALKDVMVNSTTTVPCAHWSMVNFICSNILVQLLYSKTEERNSMVWI